jgi:DNA-binding SARP family transcriptional activator/tetratricopeptide (TPR) repeat protein
MRPTLTYRILGPVAVELDGVPQPPGPPQQRAVLATLILEAGAALTTERLVDAVWGERPPPSAAKNIRVYVWRLRKVLGPVLSTEDGGYRLVVAEGALDLDEFRVACAEAARHAHLGDAERACAGYRRALALWRGPALAGVPGDALRDEAARLHAERLNARLALIDAGLALGRHEGLVDELAALAREHPYDERIHEQNIAALLGCGRARDAAHACRVAVQSLRTELGAAPGPRLERLFRRVREATGPASGAVTGPATATDRFVPVRTLPAPPVAFTGRSCEIDLLVRQLTGAFTTAGPARRATMPGAGSPGVPVGVISGPAGCGKSALAIHLAHRLAGRFPDGQLYLDLRGAITGVRPVAPLAAVAHLLAALGVSPGDAATDLDRSAALLRDRLAGRRVLLVLDNAADAAQVRPLLPGARGNAAVITSRHPLGDLDVATPLHLDVLPAPDARRLLAAVVGADRLAAEPTDTDRIVEYCGALPLALRIIAARLAARPGWLVRTAADRLADERHRLDELRLGDAAVRTTFMVSYAGLRQAGARAFRLLSLLDGPDIGHAAAAVLLAVPARAADAALDELVEAQLLSEAAPGRFRMHDLLRLFARERAVAEEPRPAREAAVNRVLEHYLASAQRADRWLGTPTHRTVHPADGLGEQIGDRVAAIAWLDAELANLLAAARTAASRESPTAEVAVGISSALYQYLHIRPYWTVSGELTDLAVAVAERRGDRAALGAALSDAGALRARGYQIEEAMALFRRGLAERRCLAPAALAALLNNIGVAHAHARRVDEAIAALTESLHLRRAIGDRPGEKACLVNLGALHGESGRHREALAYGEAALALCRSLDDLADEARTRCNLGEAYCGLDQPRTAVEHLHRALEISRRLGDDRAVAAALDTLAGACQQAGEAPTASRHATECATICRAIGYRWGEGRALLRIGRIAMETGGTGEAGPPLRAALAILEELGSPEAATARRLLALAPEPTG